MRGKRRTRPRPARFALERGNQRSFLAAYECPRAFNQFNVELEAASQDVVAQEAVLARLLDGAIETMHRQRIFRADVDDSLGGAHDIPADDHALEQRMWIAFDLVAVHVRAGIALVGIADDVFGLGLCLGRNSHLLPVG